MSLDGSYKLESSSGVEAAFTALGRSNLKKEETYRCIRNKLCFDMTPTK